MKLKRCIGGCAVRAVKGRTDSNVTHPFFSNSHYCESQDILNRHIYMISIAAFLCFLERQLFASSINKEVRIIFSC